VKKLQDYVTRGGSLAFFMGELTNLDEYNKLFKETENAAREHLFPVLLDKDRPWPDPMSDDDSSTACKTTSSRRSCFRDEAHPSFAAIPRAGRPGRSGEKPGHAALPHHRPLLRCRPDSEWDPAPKQAQVVVVLPNRNSIDQYKRAAQDLIVGDQRPGQDGRGVGGRG